MNTFHLIIASPDGNIYDGDAYMLSLRGAAGNLAVMANHTPFVTSVKPCKDKIVFGDGTERNFSVDGGILTVGDNAATLLASSFKWEN